MAPSKRKFIISFVLASLLWALISAVSVHFYYERQTERNLQKLEKQAKDLMYELEYIVEKNIQLLQYSSAFFSVSEHIADAVAVANAYSGIGLLPEREQRTFYENQKKLSLINRELKLAKEESGVIEDIWIMKRDGTTVAASNAGQVDSLVGTNYNWRKYFSEAFSGKKEQHFAMGVRVKRPGFYFSSPISRNGEVIGIVTSKVSLAAFRRWSPVTHGLLIDSHGVIIAASNPQLEMMAVPDNTVGTLDNDQLLYRYGVTEFPILLITPWAGGYYDDVVQIGESSGPMFVAHSRLIDDRIKAVIGKDVSSIIENADTGFYLALWIVVGVLFLLTTFGLVYFFLTLRVIQLRDILTIQKIDREKKRTDRRGGRFAVVHINLDNFTSHSFNMSQKTGKKVLDEMERRIQQSIRGSDTFLQNYKDMFVVLLKDVGARPDVERTVSHIQNKIHQPLEMDGSTLYLTATVGIAIYPSDGQTAAEMLAHSNVALRSVIGSKPESYAFYCREMSTNLEEYILQSAEMKKSIYDGDFYLVYQPQLSLLTGEMIGCEALVRWQHPVKGLISPVQFIPMAESTGIIHELGPWILNEACRQARAWIDEFGFDIEVSVNISPEQFLREDLLHQKKQALKTHELEPHQIQLEITETLMMSNAERTLTILRELQAIGMQVSIDDFGTGYSSLAYLRRFNADILKIDRTFIREMVTNATDRAVVSAIISLANSLDYQIIAEGVETAEQLELLREMGCHSIQGFGFSRPIPPDEFARFYQQHRIHAREVDWQTRFDELCQRLRSNPQ